MNKNQLTQINVFHSCLHKRDTIVYEVRLDVFEVLTCKWCNWQLEMVDVRKGTIYVPKTKPGTVGLTVR